MVLHHFLACYRLLQSNSFRICLAMSRNPVRNCDSLIKTTSFTKTPYYLRRPLQYSPKFSE